MRVVSFLPSATEIVCALGARPDLVGRSAECDHPPEVAGLPVVMRPRTLDPDRPSAEIDRRVRDARSKGQSLYEVDVRQLSALRPELLLTQDLCGVCSVTGDEVAQACAAADVRPKVVSLSPRTLEEVWATFSVVANEIGRADAGRRLVESARKVAAAGSSTAASSVAVVEWLDPPILAGLWTPDLVSAAGGRPVGPAPGAVGERTSWAAIADLRPDLLVLSPCSFTVERTLRELEDPRVSDLVREVAPCLGTFVADEAFFSRPGPRLAQGVTLVRALLRREVPRTAMRAVRWGTARPEVAA